MSSRLVYLFDVKEGFNLSNKVTDGHIFLRSKEGKINIKMLDDDASQSHPLWMHVHVRFK